MIVAGIDVGGTKTAVGLVQFPQGELLARRQIPTVPTQPGEADLLERTVAVTREIIKTTEEGRRPTSGEPYKIAGVGLGICELVDLAGEIGSSNCISWSAREVEAAFRDIAPVTIEADVRAAALAEALFGAGKPFRSFLYVTIGTGISCCLMLDGSPYLGAHGETGTMASSAIRVPCRECGHMNEATLEEIASGPGIVARYRKLQAGRTTEAQAVSTAQEIFSLAEAGDTTATQVISLAAKALGSSIAWVVNVVDPAAVVIGGGLGLRKGFFWTELTGAIRAHIWSERYRDRPIVPAGIGENAGMVGAAAFAFRQANRRILNLQS